MPRESRPRATAGARPLGLRVMASRPALGHSAAPRHFEILKRPIIFLSALSMCTACIQARESRSPSGRPPPPGGVAQQAHAHDRIPREPLVRWLDATILASSETLRTIVSSSERDHEMPSASQQRKPTSGEMRSTVSARSLAFCFSSARALHSKRTMTSRRMMPGARDENSAGSVIDACAGALAAADVNAIVSTARRLRTAVPGALGDASCQELRRRRGARAASEPSAARSEPREKANGAVFGVLGPRGHQACEKGLILHQWPRRRRCAKFEAEVGIY